MLELGEQEKCMADKKTTTKKTTTKAVAKKKRYTINELSDLQNRVNHARRATTDIQNSTSSTLSRLGIDVGEQVGSRDYPAVLGYCVSNQNYKTYKQMYDRGDIAKRVVDAPVAAIWANPPSVIEADESADSTKISPLNQEWRKLYKKLEVGDTFRRADKMSRLGEYSVVYVGYDDGGRLDRQKKKGAKVKYLQPLSIDNVRIAEIVNDYRDPRNGLPKYYEIKSFVETEDNSASSSVSSSPVSPKVDQAMRRVHHSRIIHVVEENIDSNIRGVPIFTHIYNRLIDLTKVVGGSAEMFWLGARPGYAMIANPDTNVTEENAEEIEEMLRAYDDDLTRWIQAQGMEIKNLAPQVYSPREHFDVLIASISAASAIPQRILTGAESGELASTQDKANWETTIVERRSIFAEPKLIDPLIAILQESGQLSEGNYQVVWADLATVSDADRADAAYKNSQAWMWGTLDVYKLKLIGPKIFGDKIMQWDEETIRMMTVNWDKTINEIIKRDEEQNKAKDLGSQTKEVVKKNIIQRLFKAKDEIDAENKAKETAKDKA